MARRTTVTLDDDVAAKLDAEARRLGTPFRDVLNEALRRGLNPPQKARTQKKFRIRGPFAQSRQSISFDNIQEVLDQIDGPRRKRS